MSAYLIGSAVASYVTVIHLPAYQSQMDPIKELIGDYESGRVQEQSLRNILEAMGEQEK
jgi:hypothetical protein